MKKKISILTSIGIGLSNIVYGNDTIMQANRPIAVNPLYGPPPDFKPPVPTFLEILQMIGKIAIIPVILIIGIIVIVKVNKKKKKKKENEVEENLNTMTELYGVFRDDK